MAKSFQELRKTRVQQFEDLRARTRPTMGTHKRTRLGRAGRGSSETLLCQRIAVSHGTMLAEDYRQRFGGDEADERLRFLTVLHSTVPLDAKCVFASIDQMQATLSHVLEGTEAGLLGAVEVEIVNLELMRRTAKQDAETRKLNVLEKLRVAVLTPRSVPLNTEVLVHFHGVVDLSNLADDDLRERAKSVAVWQRSPYQIELKRLFKTRTLIQNLTDIAMYLTKGGNDQLRYNAAFGRDLDADLEARIWRAGMGRADKGADTVPDERGLTMGEIAFLDDVWRGLMERRPDKRGYLVQIG